jgi:exodeoxyribonuclease V beta subunit
MTPFDVKTAPLKGRNLIEAAAGTGKTWSIEHLFVRLVLEQGCRVDEILVVTFTEAATDELRDRIRRRLIESRQSASNLARSGTAGPSVDFNGIDGAIADFDRAAIYTIHGFCHRVLREHAFETGSSFSTELIPDQAAILREVAEDYWRGAIAAAEPEVAGFLIRQLGGPPGLLSLLEKVKPPIYRVRPEAEVVRFRELTRYRQAFAGLGEVWANEGEAAMQVLLDATCLDAKVFGSCKPGSSITREDKVRRLREAVEALLATGPANVSTTGIDNLCTTTIAAKTHKGKSAPRHPVFDRCEDLCAASRALDAELQRCLTQIKIGFLKFAREQTARRKRARNLQSFDDLLLSLHAALRGRGGEALAAAVRSRFRAVLVDEFQDTDDVQYALFENLFIRADGCLFWIGDPKQAIYGFRGADIFAYLRAAEAAENKYTLEGNYRSTPALIKAVNTLFQSVAEPFLFDKIGFRAAGPAGNACDSPPGLVIWHLEAGRFGKEGKALPKRNAEPVVARVVASETRRLTTAAGEKNIPAGEIAVLVRTNDQARSIKAALASAGVPAVVCSTGSIFDSPEAEEVERVLMSLAVPSDAGRLKAALATSLLGATAGELDGSDPDSGWWAGHYERHRAYAEQWSREGFIPMFRAFMTGEGVKQRLLGLPDGERRVTNVLHLAELLHQAALAGDLGPSGLLRWLSRQRDPSTPGRAEHPLRLESDARAVQIVTIHKSKGLQYRVVFCPYPWSASEARGDDLLFHDAADGYALTLEIGAAADSPAQGCVARELLSENLRLLYVALTRAETRCYLVWGRVNTAETSAPAYLLHCADILSEGKEGLIERMKAHWLRLSDAEIRADLDRLAARSEGAIEVRPLPDTDEADMHPLVAPRHEALRCRTFTGVIDRSWRTGSYSSLISGSHDPDAADHDPGFAGAEVRATDVPPDKSRIADFPAGSRAGSFFHAVLEEVDFQRAPHPDTEHLIADKLQSFGFDPGWQGAVTRMVREAAEAELFPADGFTLNRLPSENRIAELEFYHSLKPLSPRTLREVFAPFGRSGVLQGFPDRLGRLTFSPLQGHMKGFIDLVAVYCGRFYLLDWKSNRLGADPVDYHGERLAAAMQGEYYVLQYHIYTLALHLYLRRRHPAYDYARDFGGVAYVFLRGLDRKRDPGLGIFRDRPDPRLVHALGRALIPDYERP